MEPDRARQLLQRERERIEQELSSRCAATATATASSSRVDQHTADAGSELFENERDQSMITRLQQELEAISAPSSAWRRAPTASRWTAASRSRTGRLEAIPWAERTAEEQARLEAGS